MSFSFAPTDKEAVLPMSEAKRQLEETVHEHCGGTIRYQVIVDNGDDIAKSILEGARRLPVGCIVMGTHGRKGMERLLLGSIAERVQRESPLPVLIIRAKKLI